MPTFSGVASTFSEIVPSISGVIPIFPGIIPSISDFKTSFSEAMPTFSGVASTFSEIVPSISDLTYKSSAGCGCKEGRIRVCSTLTATGSMVTGNRGAKKVGVLFNPAGVLCDSADVLCDSAGVLCDHEVILCDPVDVLCVLSVLISEEPREKGNGFEVTCIVLDLGPGRRFSFFGGGSPILIFNLGTVVKCCSLTCLNISMAVEDLYIQSRTLQRCGSRNS